MTVNNDADARSEDIRRRKRSAINRHMNRMHGRSPEDVLWSKAMAGMTTTERMNLHQEIHDIFEVGHDHEDIEDWQKMERMNGGEGK